MSGITTFKTWSWDERFKSIEIENKSTKIEQENMSFDREFKFKIYQLAIDAIKSNDPTQQQAAYVVVNNLVSDTTFKTGLLRLFVKSEAVAPDVRKAATVANFDILQSKNVYSVQNKMLVDIFYLTSKKDSREIAVKIQNALKSSDFYDVRLRKFEDKTNNSKGYNIKTNQLRFDANEKEKAEKLSLLINQLFLKDGIEFTTRETKQGRPTNGYLSLFVVDTKAKEFNADFSDDFR